MPSLRSNKNKKGIPTLPVPVASVCIPVNVPDDPRWIALFLGAIYQLSQQIWYDRDAEHSAKIVADKWRDIYLETVKATWDCGGMFDLRIDPLDECSIQKTNDGETWTEVFRLDTRCAIANIIRNPYTGTLGYWDDLDFYTIPDGPWTPSMYPEFSSNPPPIAGVNKECLASVTAAYVLRNLYKTVADTLLDEVGATDWDYATNLGLALQGFLMLIGAAAMQVYVSIASLLGIVGVRQQYIDYPLDDDDEVLLTCLLLDNAMLHEDDSVTFDFQNVWDNVSLDSPKNGLVRFLLTMIGPDALNYAGAIDAGLTADCGDCGAWEHTFNFAADDYDFTDVRVKNEDGTNFCGSSMNVPVWTSGLGWRLRQAWRQIGKSFARAYITGVDYTIAASGATDTVFILELYDNQDLKPYDRDNRTFAHADNLATTHTVTGLVVNQWANEIAFLKCTANDNFTNVISVTLRGEGVNPFA